MVWKWICWFWGLKARGFGMMRGDRITIMRYWSPGSCTIWLGETSWDGVDPGGSTKGLFPTSTPHPLSQAGARVTVPRLRCRLCCISHFPAFIRRGLCLSLVVVGGCGRCLSFGTLGLLLARGCLSFFVLEVLPHLFCFSSCRRLRLVLVLWCWSLLLVFLFWCPVASARPGVSFLWWLCLVFFVWCSGLPGASARPGLSPFLLVVVIGVSLVGRWGLLLPWGVRLLPWVAVVCVRCLSFGALGPWDFCPCWGVYLFFCLGVLPLCCVSFLLGGCGWQLSFVAGRCCWCFSFGALWLLPALGCFCFGGWGWCFCWLVFWGLACPGLSAFLWWLWLAFVFWRSGTFARPVVFVFLSWVAVVWG